MARRINSGADRSFCLNPRRFEVGFSLFLRETARVVYGSFARVVAKYRRSICYLTCVIEIYLFALVSPNLWSSSFTVRCNINDIGVCRFRWCLRLIHKRCTNFQCELCDVLKMQFTAVSWAERPVVAVVMRNEKTLGGYGAL